MILGENSMSCSKLIEQWQSIFEITEWTISCELISEMQVVDALEDNSPGHEFVGIAINAKKREGVIFYTRPLCKDDVIHKLLHVRFPTWSEEEVNFWTDLLMKRTQTQLAESRNISIGT